MPQTTPTYEELSAQISKLKLENKQLRLRPSIHSIDANILEFMNIKSQMAIATLSATNIEEAIGKSIIYLSKITNVHSVAFFRANLQQAKVEIVKEKNLPKKFINEFCQEENIKTYHSFLFNADYKTYTSANLSKNTEFTQLKCLQYLKKFATIFIIPLIDKDGLAVSLMILSKKEFKRDNYLKILNQSIMAQLRSSFSRILLTEQLNKQAAKQEAKIKERTLDFEKMNKELIHQIRIHRQREQALAEELELFKSIIIQQKDLVLRINKDGHILYFNPQFKNVKMLEEGMTENLIHYFGDGDFPGLNRIIKDFESGVQSVDCEIQLQIKSIEWFNFYFSPVKNRRGMLTEIQIVARNINEIKKLEYTLKDQKRMLFSMLDTTEKISFTTNKQGIIVLVSNNIEQLTGNLISSVINKAFHAFAHPEDVATIKTNIRKLVTKQKEHCSFNFRLKYPDNNWHLQKLKINTITNNKGKVLYFVGSFYEIEKSKVTI